MIKIKIDPKLIQKAIERGKTFRHNQYSIIQNGHIPGFICEEVFLDNYGGQYVGSTKYDIVLNGHKIDIKTKQCTSEPLPTYDATVAKYQEHQTCDYYVFFRILKSFEYCWILGAYPKKQFTLDANLMLKGTRDGRFLCRTDCYTMPINKLHSVVDLL